MPAGGIGDLDANNVHEASVLLCGRRIWFQYPPTEHNLRTLRDFYQTPKGETQTQQDVIKILENLEGGLAFIQELGQVVFVPPFCPAVVVSTQTSVSANYDIVTAEKLPQRLEHL